MIAEKSLVVVYLANPREKYWGRLDALTAVGIIIRGMDLTMVEEWAREIARGGEVMMGVSSVFFPLGRVEKVYLDEETGSARSVAGNFRRIVGTGPEDYF